MEKEFLKFVNKNHKSKDADSKKFVVGRFLVYVIVDSKSVDNQMHECQLKVHDYQAERIALSESFQVTRVIDQLPKGWKILDVGLGLTQFGSGQVV